MLCRKFDVNFLQFWNAYLHGKSVYVIGQMILVEQSVSLNFSFQLGNLIDSQVRSIFFFLYSVRYPLDDIKIKYCVDNVK